MRFHSTHTAVLAALTNCHMAGNQAYLIELDGIGIRFEYDDTEIGDLLDFLFKDVRSGRDDLGLVAHYQLDREEGRWRLRQTDGEFTMFRSSPIEFALPLLNQIMRHFSDSNRDSITLHSALVSDDKGSILMPGAPGSGKSMASLWLTHLGLNYHSDEMVTINRNDMSLRALTRPFTLRRAGLDLFANQVGLKTKPVLGTGEARVSALNAWISHRRVNPDFRQKIPPLRAILFPVFTTGDLCQITEISRAHAGMELMRAHFRSHSFEDHGFSTISWLAKNLPVYLMVYNRFDQVEDLLESSIALNCPGRSS